MPHISLRADTIFKINGFPITNSLILSFISIGLILLIGIFYNSQLKKPAHARTSIFYFIQLINKSLYNFFYSIFQTKITYFYPIISGFFFYILIQNWLGLIPGVGSLLIKIADHGEMHYVPLLRATTADLNTTLLLGILSVGISQFYSIKFLGIKNYIQRFYDLKNPISYFIGTLEIVSEFSKVLSFSFRLFGNIFAGEVLLTIIAFLMPIFAPLPFFFLEIFVGLIQALVFSMLTAVFISLAINKSHH
jgi:F-type H+-transporting ATPase subunit a